MAPRFVLSWPPVVSQTKREEWGRVSRANSLIFPSLFIVVGYTIIIFFSSGVVCLFAITAETISNQNL